MFNLLMLKVEDIVLIKKWNLTLELTNDFQGNCFDPAATWTQKSKYYHRSLSNIFMKPSYMKQTKSILINYLDEKI